MKSYLIAFAVLAVAVDATGRTSANQTMEHLLSLTSSSRPLSASPEFDCAWRKLAFEYAPKLQPWLSQQKRSELFDALELGVLCGVNFSRLDAAAKAKAAETKADQTLMVMPRADVYNVFVDSMAGDDSNAGTQKMPLRTVTAAVAATRKHAGEPRAIFLRAGVHRLNDTVALGPSDSGLNISAFGGENVTVSGGRALTGLQWKATTLNGQQVYAASTRGYDLPQGVPALQIGGQRATLARYPNANPELDLFPAGYITAATTWAPPLFHGEVCDANSQCGKSKNVTIPVDASKEWHGMFQNYTVGEGGACERYVDFRSPWCSGDFYLLRQFPEMHTRSPSGVDAGSLLPHAARYDAKSVAGKATVHAWRPGHWYTWMFEIADVTEGTVVANWTQYEGVNAISGLVPGPGQSTTTIKYLGQFTSKGGCDKACKGLHLLPGGAVGGVAARTCHAWTWHEKTFDPAWRGGCYAHTDTAFTATPQVGVVSARGPHSTGPKFTFSTKRGGNQGGEGDDAGGEWFVEGVKAELDAPNEFFWDEQAETLFYLPNGTAAAGGLAAPPADAAVAVPTLDILFDLQGTMAAPVTKVAFQGITFTQNRPTFMEPRTNPSGGDWSLERQGALRLEGTEDVLIRGNLFTKLDTNAISLNGYNRRTMIDRNEAVWISQNFVAAWGREPEAGSGKALNDGTGGTQPRFTSLTSNFVHEIGHIQKQSSFYFQALSCQTHIEHNIVFNIPRAAINFNDGFGGGSEIVHNLLFNTCRESGDHGAFNSWDRLPYITEVRDGKTPSTIPAVNDVHNNFIVANYAADGGCLDNDDGSSYYDIHHNFCVFGGHKQNFDGNSKRGFNNVYAYPQVYGAKCVDEETEGLSTGTSGPYGLPPAGYGEAYFNNICVLDEGAPYLSVGGSLDDRKAFEEGLDLSNNTIYSVGGSVDVTVSGTTTTLAKFQGKGFDLTSSVSGDMPTPDVIVAWARPLLGL